MALPAHTIFWLLSHAELQANGRPVECLWCAPGEEGTTFHIRHIGELRITAAMLAQIVATFQQLDKNPPRVPIQVNHVVDSGDMGESRAVGWIVDLTVRRTAERVSLEFLPSWSEEAKGVIEAGGFRYVSVGMELNGLDATTGEQLGPRLREVSITNSPAIPDLRPIELSAPLDGEAKIALTVAALARHMSGPDGEPDMLDQARQIAMAFFAAYPDSDAQTWNIEAVFYEAREMIVTEDTRQVGPEGESCQHRLWQLAFEIGENHAVSFAPRDEWEQVEHQFVPVKGDQQAASPQAALRLKAVPVHRPPMMDGDPAWDADAAERRVRAWATADGKVGWAKYRSAFAWVDAADPERFASYKLPHHDVVNDQIRLHRRGMIAAAGAVQGARGGAAIPEADMAGVRAHLAAHYAQHEIRPPWMAAAIPIGKTETKVSKESGDMDEMMLKQIQVVAAAIGVDLDPAVEPDLALLAEKAAQVAGDLAAAKVELEKANAKLESAGKQLTDSDRKAVALSTRADAADERITALSDKIASLEAEKNVREAEQVIVQAMQAGKLTAAEVADKDDPMRRLALTDRITFAAIIAKRSSSGLTEEIGVTGGDPTEVDQAEFWTLVRAKRDGNSDLTLAQAQDLVLLERPEFDTLIKAANQRLLAR